MNVKDRDEIIRMLDIHVKAFHNEVDEMKIKAKMYDKWASLIELFSKVNDSKTLTDMYDKSVKWDALLMLCEEHDITVGNIPTIISKAKLWDEELTDNVNRGIFPNPQVQEWKDKAKKWDSHKDQPCNDDSFTYITKELFSKFEEYEKKAKKWDECQKSITERYPPICGWRDSWMKVEEKAKKWDSLEKIDDDWKAGLVGIGESDRTISWRGSATKFKEMTEKAKKWDELPLFIKTTLPYSGQVEEWKNKAIAWDKVNSVVTVDPEAIVNMKEKAASYDRYAAYAKETGYTLKEVVEKAKKLDQILSGKDPEYVALPRGEYIQLKEDAWKFRRIEKGSKYITSKKKGNAPRKKESGPRPKVKVSNM